MQNHNHHADRTQDAYIIPSHIPQGLPQYPGYGSVPPAPYNYQPQISSGFIITKMHLQIAAAAMALGVGMGTVSWHRTEVQRAFDSGKVAGRQEGIAQAQTQLHQANAIANQSQAQLQEMSGRLQNVSSYLQGALVPPPAPAPAPAAAPAPVPSINANIAP